MYTENSNNLYPITIIWNNIQAPLLTSYTTETITFNQILGNETFFVENGINSYCKKFKIAPVPDEVFTQNDRTSIIDKIFSEEMESIKGGDYK